jgi:hypothetical protein
MTAAASTAARFLFFPSELKADVPPLWVPALRPALFCFLRFCGPLFLSVLNHRTRYRQLPSHSSRVLCWCKVPRGPLLHQRPAKALGPRCLVGYLLRIHYWLLIASLVSSPCTTRILWGCLAFAFPAVPHFNNRYLRVTCSPSRASASTATSTSTAPSTPQLQHR